MTFKPTAGEALDWVPGGAAEVYLADSLFPITYKLSAESGTPMHAIETSAGVALELSGSEYRLSDAATGTYLASFYADPAAEKYLRLGSVNTAELVTSSMSLKFNGVAAVASTSSSLTGRPELSIRRLPLATSGGLFRPWEAQRDYARGECVVHGGKAYVRNAAVNRYSGIFLADRWDEATLLSDAVQAPVAPAFSESATYAAGDVVLHGGGLFRCTAAVEAAGAWTGTANWAPTTVAQEVASKVDASALAGQTMPAEPTQEEIAAALKLVFAALGGTITGGTGQ